MEDKITSEGDKGVADRGSANASVERDKRDEGAHEREGKQRTDTNDAHRCERALLDKQGAA